MQCNIQTMIQILETTPHLWFSHFTILVSYFGQHINTLF